MLSLFDPAIVFSSRRGFKVHVEHHMCESATETVVLVNGALATTAAYSQSIKYLTERYNVVAYDLPYAGQSRQHNPGLPPISKEDEVDLLLELCERFNGTFIASVSWGGVSALLALAEKPATVRGALITSFSPRLNDAMQDYVHRGWECIQRRDREAGAELLNTTIGKHLPRLLKRFNHRHLVALSDDEHRQIVFNVQQVLKLNFADYAERMAGIEVPVLFLNGALDEHTTAEDIRELAGHMPHAHCAVMPDAGHFVELEGRLPRLRMRELAMTFFADPRDFAALDRVVASWSGPQAWGADLDEPQAA